MTREEIIRFVADQVRAYREEYPACWFIHPRTWDALTTAAKRPEGAPSDWAPAPFIGGVRVHVLHHAGIPVGALMEGPLT